MYLYNILDSVFQQLKFDRLLPKREHVDNEIPRRGKVP